ncbi:uncharacterized protein EI97DRAFT_459660 [Westerdykella ornata]|uniref:DUF1989 domain-containing protein n=1 Tax=Westerdykella ornata TaxID=318751 RepID=A0A6A6JF39_WESOR|nr:uncharacterized protein EI97DRAFT_459660 [Westerdykella ornata]KAF2275022.1 hypothetical protein EI97DRAFT_459660 [Westerdykella ornata]
MSGELQTIPARHGVATFVPRGRTIKIINTYGKQVVSLWAFALGAPPEGEEVDAGVEEELEEKRKEVESEIRKGEEKTGKSESASRKASETVEDSDQDAKEQSKKTEKVPEEAEGTGEAEDPPEVAPKDGTTESEKKATGKRTWSSYLPSIPYRSTVAQAKTGAVTGSKAEESQKEAATKKWSSYLPTGQSFSSYVPNVQLPDSKEVISAFKASVQRDPNKSYAEQFYDFSRTPVGAATLAAASGSGTASSLYAAYNAFTKMNPSKSDQPPMEYLSLPHTRAATHHLAPEVDDTLLTNLRSPIMTLVEDTTPGAHDTLTAACDVSLYAALGVDKPEEHGSCAENLVLALKELNEKVGLKGTKAVGADITVYIQPSPLHLFMNAPIEVVPNAQSDGSCAHGMKLKVEEPKGRKRTYVRFRAERDVVIVMSACPMDVGPQNGARPMAANFVVEEMTEEEMASSVSSLKNRATQRTAQKVSPRPKKEEERPKPVTKMGDTEKETIEAARRDSGTDLAQSDAREVVDSKLDSTTEKSAKQKRKPRKLERRSGSIAGPPAKTATC